MALPNPADPQLPSEFADLANALKNLNPALAPKLMDLYRRARVNRRLIYMIIVGFVLDISLTIGLSIVTAATVHNATATHRIANEVKTAETVDRQKALCPLYQIFLASDTPQARKAQPDPKRYDESFKVIRNSFNALDCPTYLGRH